MNPAILVAGIVVSLLAGLVALFFVIAPPPPRVARDRRLPPGVEQVSILERITTQTTAIVDSAMSRRRGRLFGAAELELAGISSTPSQFLIVVTSFASVLGLLGVVLGMANGTSIVLGPLFAILTPVGARC